MRKEKIVKKTEEKTIEAVRIIVIKEEIKTNSTTNLETDLETTVDNAATMIDEMTDPENLNNEMILESQTETKISAGNNVKYVMKTVTIGS